MCCMSQIAARTHAVIACYGFCRTTIYKWLRAAKGEGAVLPLCGRAKERVGRAS